MRHAALLLALLAPAGCRGFDLTRELPEQHRWALDVKRPVTASETGTATGAESSAATGSGTLYVGRFTVSESFEYESMLWRRPDRAFAADFTNLHLAPPSSQITAAARAWMAGTGRWKSVVTDASQLLPHQVLRGHVAQLFGDLGGDDAPAAVVEVQLYLTDVNEAQPSILHQGTYAERVPMPERSGAALAEAMSTGLAQAFARFESELAAAP